MTNMFQAVSTSAIVNRVAQASRRVLIAVPGLREAVVPVLIEAARRCGPSHVTIIVDCDEEVYRLGYGDVQAARQLLDAGVQVRHSSGLRLGVLISDDDAWVFAPTALYVQDEVHSDETPNAIRISVEEADRLAMRLSPVERDALANEASPAEADQPQSPQEADEAAPVSPREASIREEAAEAQIEVGLSLVDVANLTAIEDVLEQAPPQPFDLARQVRCYLPYVQYVEMHLTGCAIQRKKFEIPKKITQFGGDAQVLKRLRTTFDLIDKKSQLDTRDLESELHVLRTNFTRSLGKRTGRVILKSVRPLFDKRIEQFRQKLNEKSQRMVGDLQKELDKARDAIVAYYVPRVQENPPDALAGQLFVGQKVNKDVAKRWLLDELKQVIPSAKHLARQMTVSVQYRDVTFETLNETDFCDALRKHYPWVDWDHPYKAFMAAQEKQKKKNVQPNAKDAAA